MKALLALCAAAGLLLPGLASAQPVAASEQACDAVAQTGCGPGQKCAVVSDGDNGGTVACVPDGAVALGGRCGSFAGVDDCAGGLACVAGTCRQACDPGRPGACPPPQTCTSLGAIGVGTCATPPSTTASRGDAAPTCDVVSQMGCGPGEKCAVVSDGDNGGTVACVPDGAVALGGRCGSFAGVDDCAGGLACVAGTCRQACDPGRPDTCPAAQACTATGATGVGTCATLSSTPDAAVSDDAASTTAALLPDLGASTCDLLARVSGCGPGGKCTLVASDDGSRAPACVPDGTGAIGAACAVDEVGGHDNCASGTYCVQGTCQAFCDPAGLNTCPVDQTCAVLQDNIGLCAAPTSSAAAPAAIPAPLPAGACKAHNDCKPGTYCARDGTCHPESHTPLGIAAAPSLSNVRSGRICFDADGAKRVCEETVDITVDGRDQCQFNRRPVPCTWFGSEFDYEGFDPNIPIRCTWVRSRPADEGNSKGIRRRQATTGTTEFRLPGVCGHFVSAGFQNYVKPLEGRNEAVSARFNCSYDGKPLFDVEYRFHFEP